jgi:hypothetical protein
MGANVSTANPGSGPGEPEIEVPCRRWSDLRAFRDVNLAKGSAFIRGVPPAPAGTILVVVLVLPDSRRLRFRGHVSNTVSQADADKIGRAAGFEIHFARMEDNQWQWIERQLAINDPPPDPEMVERVREELRRLEPLDPFAVLGVGRNATQVEIDQAFQAFAQRHHPMRLETAPFEARQLAASIAQLGGEAYNRIGTPERRAETEAQMCAGKMRYDLPTDADVAVGSAMGADGAQLREQARLAMRQKRWGEAVRIYSIALTDAPRDKELLAARCVAQAQAALSLGDDAGATQLLQTAVSTDPTNAEALRALRGLQQKAMEKKGGTFAGLFKRKK